MIRQVLGALVLISFLACGNDDPINMQGVENSRAYFPLALGRFVDYQVDSVVFDDAPGGNKKDTISFQVREEVVHLDLTQLGDTLYYIHRFRRDSAAMPWSLTDVWTARYEENNVLRTEENLTFRKMTLPLYKGLEWISTAYINPQTPVKIGTEVLEPYQYWESRVTAIDDSMQVGDYRFPPGTIMQVIQTDTDDQLTKRYVHEVYARGIGLVSRRDTILDSRCIDLGDFTPCIDKAWSEHASKGYILSQLILDHN